MRISTFNDDPGYIAPAITGGCKVFFNGAEMKGVLTADEEKRLIVQADFDARGNYQLNAERTELKTLTLYGDVRVHLPCRKCGGEMRPSAAFENTARPSRLPDFPGEAPGGRGATITFDGPAVLLRCMKCSACGWSVTA